MKQSIFSFSLHLSLALSSTSIIACSWCEEWNLSPRKEEVTLPSLPEIEKTPALQSAAPEQNSTPHAASHEHAFASILEALHSPQGDAEGALDFQKLLATFMESSQGMQSTSNAAATKPPLDDVDKENLEEKTSAAAKKFYDEYLLKFYPKVLVIADYFYDLKKPMCPIAINAAIKEFIAMLSDKTWFVFQNRPQGFKHGEHWEVIIEECKRLDRSLRAAYYNVVTKKVVMGSNSLSLAIQDSEVIPLTRYWKDQDITDFYDFYAHYADYLVAMFNEGVHTENIKQCSKYSYEYKNVIAKIPEGMFDSKYHEHDRINKELIAELRKKLGVNEGSSLFSRDFYEDMFPSDENEDEDNNED